MKKRVVITGLGPITPIGIGKGAFWDALMAGKSGARTIEFEDCHMDLFNSRIGCTIDDFSLTDFLHKRKDFRYLGRTSTFAMAATKLALEDAGLELDYIEGERGQGTYVVKDTDPERIGVILGVGAQNMDLCEKWHRQFLRYRGPKRLSPFGLPHVQICAVPVNVTLEFGLKGIACTVSTACASSNHAMIEAYKQILFGEEEVMVTGGADACITPFIFGGFIAMNAMSRQNDAPERASRPFDRDRDGFVMGEGSGIVILEDLDHARDRGAHIYCELLGCGATSDAYHIAAPDPEGEAQARAMKIALRTADTYPEEIDYINAHGTSTPLNDPAETLAIRKALGEAAEKVAINSTKSMTGHLIGAAGGVEMIATALMVERGMIHPTINLENPGEGCDLFYVPGKPIQRDIGKAMSNSFGFGGQNASIVVGRYDPEKDAA
ncbi:MAG TPA: beta-ketoacyl-[acyl-carrier-protein] synthase II [Deltaproteobacteria bacterium]|nr:beta-ketoacyl-ACP synthase II [Deltaproteobacteria bacterium]HDZ89512.1 beta-ketoacyl-[acyl-carrier-protein] synthase II [Deltaproteobacteria bacterium]